MLRGKGWWDKYFLELARYISTASKDPSTQCGAVVVRPDKTIASVGFNGFPRGTLDDEELYADRAVKYMRVIHAEENAILNAREPLKGYTIYTYPPGFGPSCSHCSAVIIQAGITRIVHLLDRSDFAGRWRESSEYGLQMYREANVEVTHYE